MNNHSAELLKLLTLNLPDMLWIKDLDGIYIYANPYANSQEVYFKPTKSIVEILKIYNGLKNQDNFSV